MRFPFPLAVGFLSFVRSLVSISIRAVPCVLFLCCRRRRVEVISRFDSTLCRENPTGRATTHKEDTNPTLRSVVVLFRHLIEIPRLRSPRLPHPSVVVVVRGSRRYPSATERNSGRINFVSAPLIMTQCVLLCLSGEFMTRFDSSALPSRVSILQNRGFVPFDFVTLRCIASKYASKECPFWGHLPPLCAWALF